MFYAVLFILFSGNLVPSSVLLLCLVSRDEYFGYIFLFTRFVFFNMTFSYSFIFRIISLFDFLSFLGLIVNQYYLSSILLLRSYMPTMYEGHRRQSYDALRCHFVKRWSLSVLFIPFTGCIWYHSNCIHLTIPISLLWNV